MLPPVTATVGSDVTFSNLPAQQMSGAQVIAVGKSSAAEGNSNPASLFAKANLASLSSQLQLTQNVTVMADAIGKLMNLPKLDDETARAYVTRLVTTIQSMPTAQRNALEVQIGRILPGLSLAILTDILKNPTGPQAARLAFLLETAPHRGNDLAAKAVVSSYRQNIGGEPRSNPAPTAPPTNQTASSASSNSNLSNVIRAAASVIANSAQGQSSGHIAGQNSANSSLSLRTPTSVERPTLSIEIQARATANVAQGTTSDPKKGTLPTRLDGSAGQMQAQQLRANQQAGLQTTAPSLSQNVNEQQATGQSEAGSLSLRKSLSPSVQIAVANARPLELRARFEPMSRSAPSAANDGAVPAKNHHNAGRDATGIITNPVAALITAIGTAKLPNAAESSQSLFASLVGMVKSSIKDLSFSQTSSSAGQTSEIDNLLEQLKNLPKNEIQAKLLEAIRHLPPDHPQVQALLMSALRNELAPALPYVNYPSADDNYETEHHPRGQWSSNNEDESLEQNAEQNSQGGEQDDERSEDSELAASDLFLQDDEQADRHAENYYLRMSNFL